MRHLSYYAGKLFHNRGIVGVILILLSFGHWFFPITYHSVLISNLFFYLGNISLFDHISQKLTGDSLLNLTVKTRRKHFLLLGFCFGIPLEIVARWWLKLWYYPYWDISTYVLILIPGFAIYAFYLIETYLGTKAILEHFFFKPKKHSESFIGLKKLFIALGIIGTAGLSSLSLYLILLTPIKNGLGEVFSVQFLPGLGGSPVGYWLGLALAIFAWLFLEYIEYEERENSMLLELIHGNPAPIISVFVAAGVSALFYEIFNLPGGLWRYANFPYSQINLLGIPLFVFIAWPFHYFPLFSLYRVLFKKETQEVWK